MIDLTVVVVLVKQVKVNPRSVKLYIHDQLICYSRSLINRMRLQTWTSAYVESITESTCFAGGREIRAGQYSRTGMDVKIIIAALNRKWKFVSSCVHWLRNSDECVRSINRIHSIHEQLTPVAADLDFGVIYSSFIHPQAHIDMPLFNHNNLHPNQTWAVVVAIYLPPSRSLYIFELNEHTPPLDYPFATTQSANKRKITHTICFMRALFSSAKPNLL